VARATSSAWPLSLLFAGLIVYASLYPFEGWRSQGVDPLAFLWAPLPEYWTGFDVGANLLGYAPLGLLLSLAARRSGRAPWAWPLGVVVPALLSLAVEITQNYLLLRIASNVDVALNVAGGVLGAALAALLDRLGWVAHWSRWRDRWFLPSAHGGLVLLALWPAALLYPASVPFGLGQVWDRTLQATAEVLADTPFLAWLPPAGDAPVPLSPLAEGLCVGLCLLAPLLLAYADLRNVPRRLLFLPLFLAGAAGVAGLSSALTYGPSHAWAWLSPPAWLGLGMAALAGLALVGLPRRLCAALMLLCLAFALGLLNRAPASPYFAQSLEVWEQGRFIRFHGLSQWLGWLWPYAALAVGLRAVARPSAAG